LSKAFAVDLKDARANDGKHRMIETIPEARSAPGKLSGAM
jgi:hypothetical protein